MNRILCPVAFAAALALSPAVARAQQCGPGECVTLNGALLRVGVGVQMLSLADLPGGTPAREGVGL